MRVAVYTAIFGEKDQLNDPSNYSTNHSSVDYYCCTDNQSLMSNVYNIVYKNPEISSLVKKSRFFKINGAEELIGYDYLIWHDGNIQINAEKIENLIIDLGDNFLAAFKHPYRNNIFDESKICVKRNKDNFFKIIFQLTVYMWYGVSTESNLYETGILVKNNRFKNDFYYLWWEDVRKYSSRDQISLSYLVEKRNIKLSILVGEGTNNPYSKYHPHIFKPSNKTSIFNKIQIKLFVSFIEFLKSFQKNKKLGK